MPPVPALRAFLAPLPTLILVSLTAHMALSGGRLAGSLYALHTGAGTSWMGLFMGLFAVLPLLSSLSVGRWIDRRGAQHVMRRGVLLVCTGAWLPVLQLSMPMLFAMAMFLGIGFNLISMASLHAVGTLSNGHGNQRRLANYGWFGLGFASSATIGPSLAGVLIDHAGFRAAFAVLALFSTTAVVLVFGALRTVEALAAPPAPPPPAALQAAQRRQWNDLLRDPVLRRVFLVSVVLSAAWDLFGVMLPVVGTRMGYSASMVGAISSMFALGIFTSRAMTPLLATRFPEWVNVRAALAVIVLALVVWPWAAVPWAFMVLAYGLGVGLGLSQPNTLSLLHAATPADRAGEALGLRYFLGNCSSVLMPVVFGVGVGLVGVAPLLWAGATLVGSCLPATQRAIRQQRLGR